MKYLKKYVSQSQLEANQAFELNFKYTRDAFAFWTLFMELSWLFFFFGLTKSAPLLGFRRSKCPKCSFVRMDSLKCKLSAMEATLRETDRSKKQIDF